MTLNIQRGTFPTEKLMLGRDNTYATNPGGIKVDLLRTMRWDWWLFALAAVVAVGAFFFGLLVVKKNGVTYGVPFACLAAPFMMQMQNNRRFQSGALIPGYVVQADPCLVAALSDMGTGKDDREIPPGDHLACPARQVHRCAGYRRAGGPPVQPLSHAEHHRALALGSHGRRVGP